MKQKTLNGDCIEENIKRKRLFHKALKNFKEFKAMKYEEKIIYTEELIKATIKRFGDNVCVACSFGKDSTLMLYLVRKFKPNVRVIFANTGVQYQETYKFRDFIVKAWNLDYYEVKPIKTFWQCVKEYGYPNIRLPYSKRRAKKKKRDKPKCCYYCKDKPCLNFYRKNRIEAVFVGMNWDESFQRRYTIITHKDCYFVKSDKIWKVLPIAYWTTQEVWRYIKENDLPVNEVYNFSDRSGCMPCTSFISWKKQLARANPKMLQFILKDRYGQNQLRSIV